MKRAVTIFLLSFYTLGTLFLPMGDFAMLKNLPEMFRHCKATEDSDLDVFEFLTEHVSPIGQIIEGAEHESEEDGDKPHETIPSINYGQVIAFIIPQFSYSFRQFYHFEEKKHSIHSNTFFATDYTSKIFRPPIVA